VTDEPPRSACPCCGERLVEPPGEGSVDLADSREGDAWCDACHWLLIREELNAPELTVRCPTHE